jgi:hypothetical protein
MHRGVALRQLRWRAQARCHSQQSPQGRKIKLPWITLKKAKK